MDLELKRIFKTEFVIWVIYLRGIPNIFKASLSSFFFSASMSPLFVFSYNCPYLLHQPHRLCPPLFLSLDPFSPKSSSQSFWNITFFVVYTDMVME